MRLDDPLPLLFWLPTLWGGGALVLLGTFRETLAQRSRVLVICGSFLGFVPSAWTILMPLMIIALVALTVTGATRQSLDTAPPAS